MPHCPICKKTAASRPENDSFPFCSERCKLVDLGKWVLGEYRIPGRPEEAEDALPSLDQNPDGEPS